MNMMKKVALTFAFATLCFGGYLFAQGPGGPPGGPGASGPIDGGAIALVVGAAAYGYRKLRNNTKSDKPV